MAVNKEPQVSVVTITYNQEKYIRRAIEGVLSQETSFPYEFIIGEDCSTDGTREICVEYSQQYPDKIRLLQHTQNVGMHQNAIQAIQLSKGKYIALCEGDDYWTDPNKLQMQYEMLEKHPEYSGIHTKVEYVDGDGCKIGVSDLMPEGLDAVDFNYLVQKNVICTCSFMFRKKILDAVVVSLLKQSPIQDYTLFLATALKGDIYYLDRVTAAYRRSFGVSAKWVFSQTKRKHLIIYSLFEKQYNLKKYRRAIYAARQYHYYHSKLSEKRMGKCVHFLKLLWYSFLTSTFPPQIRANQIRFKDVIEFVSKHRPKLRNQMKRSCNNLSSSGEDQK